MSEEPWWNDGNKIAGLAATTVFIIVLAILIALTVKFIMWLF